MPKQIIYARVSTEEQATTSQVHELALRYPNAAVVSEVRSSTKRRPILEALVVDLEAGDTLIVYALDRLGRRVAEIIPLIEDLQRRGIVLISHREGVDYSTPVGRLVTQILVSVAEMERSRISERVRTGLAAARAQGRVGGRPSQVTPDQRDQCQALRSQGLSFRAIAVKTSIPLATVARILKAVRGVGNTEIATTPLESIVGLL